MMLGDSFVIDEVDVVVSFSSQRRTIAHVLDGDDRDGEDGLRLITL